MPLVFAPLNVPVKILKILADEKTKKHLENLGLTIDSEVVVLSAGGSVILNVKDGRLALDREIATKIMVKI